MKTSEKTEMIAEALAKAQGSFKNPERNRTVKVKYKDSDREYEFSYATLDCILETVRKPLSENGLSIIQPVEYEAATPFCITRLMHGSGQWIETAIPVEVMAKGAQAFGSALTYARRYGIVSLLAIAAEEDDDANSASGNEHTKSDRPESKKCPKCGAAAIIKGKQEYGGGWLCYQRKGGCGFKWPDGDAEIEGTAKPGAADPKGAGLAANQGGHVNPSQPQQTKPDPARVAATNDALRQGSAGASLQVGGTAPTETRTGTPAGSTAVGATTKPRHDRAGAPLVLDPANKSKSCQAWYNFLEPMVGNATAKKIWESCFLGEGKMPATHELRFSTLKDFVESIEQVLKVLGTVNGQKLIDHMFSDYELTHEGVQNLRKSLIRAANGEVHPGQPTVPAESDAGPDDPNKPPF